jgi:hypothetical protein
MGELTRESASEAPWYRRVAARADWTSTLHRTPDHMLVVHEEQCGPGADVDEHVQRVVALLSTCGLGEDFEDLRISVTVTYRQEAGCV